MNIYLDIQNHAVVQGLNNAAPVSGFRLVLRDQVPVTLYVLTVDAVTGNYVQGELPAGKSLIFGANTSGNIANARPVYTPTWTKSGTGANAVYLGVLTLADSKLAALVPGSDPVLFTGEFRIVNADGTYGDSCEFPLTILPDINRSGQDAFQGGYSGALVYEVIQNGVKYVLTCNSEGQVYRADGPAGAPPYEM